MIQILLAADDPQQLASLRQVLRHQRSRWSMTFAASAGDAAHNLALTQPDVVVADLRLPGVHGSSFLAEVRDERPDAVRIALGEGALGDQAIGAVPIAHQFVPTPCDPVRLEAAVDRSLTLRARLADPALRALVTGLACLPSPSTTVLALQRAIARRPVDPTVVAGIVRDDVALSTKVLQVVNSAYFGLPRALTDAHEAVTYLGPAAIGELVVCGEIFRSARSLAPGAEEEIEAIQAASTRRADLAAELAGAAGRTSAVVRDVWTAAFLADVGRLVLAGAPADVRAGFVERRSDGSVSTWWDASTGLTTASIGAHLITLWGLPHHLVEAVALWTDPPVVHGSDGATFAWLAARVLEAGPDGVGDEHLTAAGLSRARVHGAGGAVSAAGAGATG